MKIRKEELKEFIDNYIEVEKTITKIEQVLNIKGSEWLGWDASSFYVDSFLDLFHNDEFKDWIEYYIYETDCGAEDLKFDLGDGKGEVSVTLDNLWNALPDSIKEE